jgi:hypothetical protein
MAVFTASFHRHRLDASERNPVLYIVPAGLTVVRTRQGSRAFLSVER